MATVSEMEDTRAAEARRFRRARTLSQSVQLALCGLVLLLGSIVLAHTFTSVAARSAATALQIKEGRAAW